MEARERCQTSGMQVHSWTSPNESMVVVVSLGDLDWHSPLIHLQMAKLAVSVAPGLQWGGKGLRQLAF